MIDATRIPSVLMPALWKFYWKFCHGLQYQCGWGEACDRYGLPRESAAQLWQRTMCGVALLGNDLALATFWDPRGPCWFGLN